VKNMEKARLAALGVVVKELLATYNGNEARQQLIKRLFNNGGATGEIGNLLPGYDPVAGGDVTFYITALKNGTRSPESIIIDILATTNTAKGFFNRYFEAANSDPRTYLENVYRDLFKGTGLQFSWLPATVQSAQVLKAATPAGRLALVRSLVNGANVTYHPNGNTANTPVNTYDHDNNPATAPVPFNFRNQEVNLAYQQVLGRFPTAAELTAGRSLIARPLAAGSLQGSEWVHWKLLSSLEFFSLQTQNDGLPDDGLHTNRSWVEGVIAERFFRTAVGGHFSTDTERDTYSKKILDRFKLQRAAFVNSILKGTEYKTLKVTEFFELAHADHRPGPNPTATELTTALTALANGAAYQSILAGQFASDEFFGSDAPQFVGGGQPSPSSWAKAVYQRLLGRDPTTAEESFLVARASTVAIRKSAILAVLNGATYRTELIRSTFQRLLGRDPTGAEVTAYLNYLKTHRWEQIIVDVLANGAASPAVTAGLPRDFWEEAH